MRALVELVLQALLPLLLRRVQAAERQAEYTELQYRLLRQYLGYSDPTFAEVLEGREQAVQPEEPDVYAEHGDARDLKSARMEELRELWYREHGELLDDDRLVQEYDRLYHEAEDRLRLDPDAPAEVRT